MKWKTGRVKSVITGKDNLVRGVVVTVFQPNSKKCITLNRPLQLIVPLEINKETPPKQQRRTKKVAAANADAIRRELGC